MQLLQPRKRVSRRLACRSRTLRARLLLLLLLLSRCSAFGEGFIDEETKIWKRNQALHIWGIRTEELACFYREDNIADVMIDLANSH